MSNCSSKFAEQVYSAVMNSECNTPLDIGDAHHVYLIGNGGSSSVASHIAVDLMKFSRHEAHVLTDPALLTCFANDYGYENALREVIDRYISGEDALICISSSGRSENITRAAAFAHARGAYVATFTGFDWDNPLRAIGDCNYWVPSHNYGVVECAHLVLLHSLVNDGMEQT